MGQVLTYVLFALFVSPWVVAFVVACRPSQPETAREIWKRS